MGCAQITEMSNILKRLANAASSQLSLPTANWLTIANKATTLADKSLTGITVLYSITISYHVRARDGYQIKIEIESASNQFDVHEDNQSEVATICSAINDVDSPYAIAALRLSSCSSCGVTVLASGDSLGTWIHNYGHLKDRTVDVCGRKKPLMIQQNNYWIPNPELFPLFAVVFLYPGDKGQISTGACHPGSETLKKESSEKIDEYKDDQNETINVYRISYTYTCSSLDFKPVVAFGCNAQSQHHPIRTEILDARDKFQTCQLLPWDSSSITYDDSTKIAIDSVAIKSIYSHILEGTGDLAKVQYDLDLTITCKTPTIYYGTHFCKSDESASNYFTQGLIPVIRDTFSQNSSYSFDVHITSASVMMLTLNYEGNVNYTSDRSDGVCFNDCKVEFTTHYTGTLPINPNYCEISEGSYAFSALAARGLHIVNASSPSISGSVWGQYPLPVYDCQSCDVPSQEPCSTYGYTNVYGAAVYFLAPSHFTVKANVPKCNTYILASPTDSEVNDVGIKLYYPKFSLSNATGQFDYTAQVGRMSGYCDEDKPGTGCYDCSILSSNYNGNYTVTLDISEEVSKTQTITSESMPSNVLFLGAISNS